MEIQHLTDQQARADRAEAQFAASQQVAQFLILEIENLRAEHEVEIARLLLQHAQELSMAAELIEQITAKWRTLKAERN